MALRRASVSLSVLSLLLLVFCLVLAHRGYASELTVDVFTDRAEYGAGEYITITVRVTLAGQPVAAKIDLAYIDISYAGGYVHRHYITWDFIQVSPGAFVATAPAGQPGSRQVYVAASATIQQGCCCQTVCAFGIAYFTVRQACQPCAYYQPCSSCCQPCQPCAECRPPDFFVKHILNPAEAIGNMVSLTIPRYVIDQLLQIANPVTFREAPPHSVMWSDVPGLGWANEPLADLGLSLDPMTGKISGYLTAAGNLFESHFFFIEALNAAGEVIAGIWIEIAFV
jgi:hypothetical protein